MIRIFGAFWIHAIKCQKPARKEGQTLIINPQDRYATCPPYGRASETAPSNFHRDPVRLFFNLLLEFPSRVSHLALKLLDLNQVLGIEGSDG